VADQSLEEFKAFNADRRLARLLGVPVGTALLVRNRTALDPERRAMEFDVGHDRCERFALTLNLRPE
jgi:DNA-binding GntR family transcriptional regulator